MHTVRKLLSGVSGLTYTGYPLEALRVALKKLECLSNEDIHLIHHSERGVQYVSKEYVRMLLDQYITISMTNPR
jgi:transposase InsO family protein